jgi:hypothetical protein
LGELTIEASGNWADVSVEFTLPDDVPPGEYWVNACNDPCEKGFGDLIGSILYVGTDPPGDDSKEPEPATTTVAEAPVTTTTVVTVTEAASAPKPTVTYLSLAPYPTRNTGLKIAWVAIPAAIAVAALGVVDLARRRLQS